ncbi:DUF1150 family protein [Henriciella sp. AS95]|uniref:DUF1150 family protein n=1 Tax=Henriciella sp. AS95 TaxID=3135782 RepID=UPI00317BE589
MTTELETKAVKLFSAKDLVYVRRIAEDELAELAPEALDAVSDTDSLFVLANGEGLQLAIIEGRDAAFAAARAHEMRPVSVH